MPMGSEQPGCLLDRQSRLKCAADLLTQGRQCSDRILQIERQLRIPQLFDRGFFARRNSIQPVTSYVARALARSPYHRLPNIKARKSTRRVRNIQRGVDASTIRRIQRMLSVGH